MTNRIDDLLRAPYTRVLVPAEEGGYFGWIAEVPGATSEGDSAAEAMANLEEAFAGVLEALIEAGRHVPPPSGEKEFSGRLQVRLGPRLHERAARAAELEGISLNQFLVTAVSAWFGERSVRDDLVWPAAGAPGPPLDDDAARLLAERLNAASRVLAESELARKGRPGAPRARA